MAETADIEARTAEIQSKAADRLTFFSDAVVAIATAAEAQVVVRGTAAARSEPRSATGS